MHSHELFHKNPSFFFFSTFFKTTETGRETDKPRLTLAKSNWKQKNNFTPKHWDFWMKGPINIATRLNKNLSETDIVIIITNYVD